MIENYYRWPEMILEESNFAVQKLNDLILF